jgi:glycosyltransferase 2 family protein
LEKPDRLPGKIGVVLRKNLRVMIALAIIVVSLAIAFQGINIGAVAAAVARLNLWYLPPAVVVFWLSFGGRVFRWQLLFTPYKVRWSKVLSTLSIGYFLSNITPLRVGDVARAYLLGTIERVPVPRALSSVVVERVSDALTIVLFLVLLLPIIPNIPDFVRGPALAAGISGLALMVAFAALSLQRERGINLLKRLTSRVRFLQRDSLWHALENLIDGFAVLHSARPLFGVVVWSLLVWGFAALLNWMFMLAMGINLGFEAAGLVIVATSLAVTVMPTPGQFGVFHLAAQLTLTRVYHVDPAAALAYAFVIHAYVYVWLMVVGSFFMWREGLSYGKLQAVELRGESIGTVSTQEA